MKVISYESSDIACKSVAEYICSKINSFRPTKDKPFVIGLPTGSSPIKVYAELVALHQAEKLDFTNVVSFNMDEYKGLGKDDEQSYKNFMYHHLFDHVNMKEENINILNGLADDVEGECSRYEHKLASYGGIQLFLGGLGPEGHIAFNEAGSSRDSKTREVDLVESTIQANSRFFGNDLSKVPTKALSVGISTVLDNSEEIVILVFGKAKQAALETCVRGKKNDPKFPSTYLHDHENTTMVTDFEAINSFQSHL